MPLKIDRDQTSSPIVVPVTNSASLTARIVLYDHSTLRAALTGEDPIAVDSLGRVVSVEDDQGRRRRLTSADGTARFDDLRPGTWTLRLVDPSLPDDHVLTQETHTIKLTPGATDSVTVKVVPRSQNDPTASQSGKTLGGEAMPQDRTSASSTDSGRTLTASSSTSDASTDESATGEKHEVKHVEWLAQLSRNYYDTLYCWTVIWEANRDELADPDELHPGMELTIPPAEACTVEKPGPPIPDSLRPSVQRHSLLPPTETVAPPTGHH
ncbi:LysM peptidoglycan-binding domain-containing protein [Salinibacter sp. 10B]|uniref:LysM peptidoglycan-binding domain-containing protein n=1 Tax=Salinibacter sp. 10B TaxID=1923971 RepID=UPI0011B0E4AD|nr:LysM peptidoglycan-binding domain-containing protein [Salinibacter sp. 10B]